MLIRSNYGICPSVGVDERSDQSLVYKAGLGTHGAIKGLQN